MVWKTSEKEIRKLKEKVQALKLENKQYFKENQDDQETILRLMNHVDDLQDECSKVRLEINQKILVINEMKYGRNRFENTIISDVYSQQPEIIDLYYLLRLASYITFELFENTIDKISGYSRVHIKISIMYMKLNYEITPKILKEMQEELYNEIVFVKSLSNDTFLMRVLLKAEEQLSLIDRGEYKKKLIF